MSRGARISIWALVCLVAFGLSYLAGYRYASHRDVEVVRDTVTVVSVVRDTVEVEKPVYVKERVVENVYVPVTDTLRLHDTTFVVLPRFQREYADSLYTAWVSGYDPRLDSIRIVRTLHVVTQTVTVKEPPKRWGLGVTAGYGLTLAPQPQLSPFIGVGVSYNLVSW